MYYRPTCPVTGCHGQLIVDFDNYENPSYAYIRCQSCGYVVVVLHGSGVPKEDSSTPSWPSVMAPKITDFV